MITCGYRQVIMWGKPPSAVRRAKLDGLAPIATTHLTASITRWIIKRGPPRSTVGHLPLEQGIGVRIPGGQPSPFLLSQLPTYCAYRLRAIPVSVVPLIIARPSGNSVI